MEQNAAGGAPSSRRFRSPWLDQVDTAYAPSPLAGDVSTDVAIVGAGIAGVATAFFMLRDTPDRVLLVEGGRVGHGASGRNAGQLVTYFERPLCDLVDTFGFDLATRGQAEVESAWGLLDLMIEQSGIKVRVDRFVGAMGMFNLNHLLVHLRNNDIRRRAGLDQESIAISTEATFLDQIPREYADLYEMVPQARIRELLELEHDAYVAVLLNRKGCANSALICQEVLRYLGRQYPDRFAYADQTIIERVVLDERSATLTAGRFHIKSSRVVLCTNGFDHHTVENRAGALASQRLASRVRPRIGYMAGFISEPGIPARATSYITNEQIGGSKPYYYVTCRPYDRNGRDTTLICLGGPETIIESAAAYAEDADMPVEMLNELDNMVRPLAAVSRPGGLEYDYTWHGLMGYTANKVRIVGFEATNSVLMYNLGCNGVGLLPSIAGAQRIARLQSGQNLGPSIFDPV